MAERVISSLVSIIPIFILLPTLNQLIQQIQAGQFDITRLFNLLLPIILISTLTELFK